MTVLKKDSRYSILFGVFRENYSGIINQFFPLLNHKNPNFEFKTTFQSYFRVNSAIFEKKNIFFQFSSTLTFFHFKCKIFSGCNLILPKKNTFQVVLQLITNQKYGKTVHNMVKLQNFKTDCLFSGLGLCTCHDISDCSYSRNYELSFFGDFTPTSLRVRPRLELRFLSRISLL